MIEMTMNCEPVLIGLLAVNSVTAVALICLLKEMLAQPDCRRAKNLNGAENDSVAYTSKNKITSICDRRRTLCAVTAALALMVSLPTLAAAMPVVLGLVNPGAESTSDKWDNWTSGTGSVSLDGTDPATGSNDFTIGNTVAGAKNRAIWRSKFFALGPAASGAGPITFSFAYKLPDRVISGDTLWVYLRYFDKAGDKFLGKRQFPVGSTTHDSNMAEYKIMTESNIYAPREARLADIIVTANIFGHWTSGTGRFDDFSVTADPGRVWLKLLVRTGLGLGLGTALAVLVMWIRYARR
jgi:hypothetical protein